MQPTAEQELFKTFKTHFCIAIVFFVLLIPILFLPFFIKSEMEAPQFVIVIHIALVIGFMIAIAVSLVSYIKDYIRYVRKNEYETLTGKVISYQTEETGGKNPKTVRNPIVLNDSTGEEIVMKIENEKDAVIGKTYTFFYFPNTKIAVIEKKHST